MEVKDIAKKIYTKYLEKNILNFKKKFLIILMYHNIGNYQRNNTITPNDFEKGIYALLNLGFRNYSLSELIKTNFYFEDKGFVITFDDGERGVIEFGLPILKKYNLDATLFISPFLIGKSYGFSWTKVPKSIITLKELDKYSGFRIDIMNEKDIGLWLEMGFKIGSHGYTHLDLASISLNDKYLKKEIYLSQKIIEDKFGVKVEIFCYPFGSFNEKVKNFVKKYYKCALTVESNVILKDFVIDWYKLPRISGGNDFELCFKIYNILKRIHLF